DGVRRVVGRERVEEVEPRRLREPGEQGGLAQHRHRVPLHLRVLDAVGQPAHHTGQDAEPGATRVLVRRVVEELHADADPEEGHVAGGDVARDRRETRAVERVHATSERADAGEHDARGIVDDRGIGGQPGVRADVLQRLLGRAQVADAVVEHRDERAIRCGQRVPFVDGTDVPSMRDAARNERATPLNAASMMWCVFSPERLRTCNVIAAAVANECQKWPAISGLNGGSPSGSTSPKGTSHTTKGRPDRSTATSTSASSRGNRPLAKRATPTFAPTASANVSPSVMPTSSTVWCPSTCRSPVASTLRSKPPWRASCSSM